ncbi:glucosyl-dolichyl phosphate glucuronosyltransferase [Halobacteriaceae archaeon SHR40]|uniref:glucosyl-dolichyl phosphate glucuronosyltransferase n=1 Tax=Halovenus amylolytica TaxID=2500550 RepID=UPI000FE2F2B9
MKVSVVVCTYSEDRYEDFVGAVDSIRRQTYDDIEIVIVVDGNKIVYERVQTNYDAEGVLTHCNDNNIGLLESRNKGAELANGDIVAFIDDDAIANKQWVEKLVSVYEQRNVEAVGGRMTPIWVAGKPSYLPEEFYWLVGVTHRGFGDEGEVRNTFGSNISFRRNVFLDLGGFDPHIGGRQGDKNLQGGETELAARLRTELNGTLYYKPGAEVGHKVFEYRTELGWLLRRAFWQGYSKRGMEVLVPDSGDEETAFLRDLLLKFIPDRLEKTLTGPSFTEAQKCVMLVVFTGCVGLGYLYGCTKWR